MHHIDQSLSGKVSQKRQEMGKYEKCDGDKASK